jgi:hypothetical protein
MAKDRELAEGVFAEQAFTEVHRYPRLLAK